MKKLIIILLVSVAAMSCQSKVQNNSQATDSSQSKNSIPEKNTAPRKSEETHNNSNNNNTTKVTYRNDGFYNGIASEFIQVAYSENASEITGMWYWNSQDDNKIKLSIQKINYVDGEISVISGEYFFPNLPDDIYKFAIIESQINVTHADDRFQEFEFESSEN